jgi:endonuclease YncB( thermonuclease family)
MCEQLSLEKLEQLRWSDSSIEQFSFNGRNILGKVVSIYDGDTCKVNLFVGNDLKQFTVRMMGYDSPEMRTKNTTEKQCGNISKTVLIRLVEGHIVRLECLEFDKYGRLLANVFVRQANGDELNVNEFMISNHFGCSYLGGTKSTFDELYVKQYYKLDNNVAIPETFNYA